MSVKLSDALNLAWMMTGQDSSKTVDNLSGNAGLTDQFNMLLFLLQNAVAKAWRMFDWPATMTIEQRFFAPVFDYYTAYVKGTVIYDPVTQAYWQASADTLAGESPTRDPGVWAAPASTVTPRIPLTSPNRAVAQRMDITGTTEGGTPLVGVATAASAVALGTIFRMEFAGQEYFAQLLGAPQSAIDGGFTATPNDADPVTNNVIWVQVPGDGLNETPIGIVRQATRTDPRACHGRFYDESFHIFAGGIYLDRHHCGNSAWLQFQLRVPTFTLTAYAGGTTYAAGALVYSGGDTWLSLQDGNTGHTPAADSIYWSLVEFPWWLKEYAARQAYADWLIQGGITRDQGSVATQAASMAEEALSEAWMNEGIGQDQGSHTAVVLSARRAGRGFWYPWA
jgi:hypothetical protein